MFKIDAKIANNGGFTLNLHVIMTKTGTKGKKKPVARRRKSGKRKKIRQFRIGIWAIAGICAGLLLWFLWPYMVGGPREESGSKVPPGPFSYGIDISHYQHDVQWDSLMVMTDGRGRTTLSKLHAKDIKPVSFVFIKASEGASMKDKRFRVHWKSAGKSGIRRGAYHFFRSSKDPVQQAQLFIKTVGRLAPEDLPPVLDIETIHKGCSRKTLNDRALRWLKEVERHYGRKPVIYSSAHFIRDILSDEIKSNYPIWVAHYDTETPDHDNWDIWQFSDKAVVYGIDGYVDLNVVLPDALKAL